MGRSKTTAICAECGQPYTTLSQTVKRTIKRFGKYVCPDCAKTLGREKAKKRFIEKYGVDNPAKNPDVQEKMQNTCLERYGYTTPFASNEVQEKIRSDRKERTGFDNPAKNPEIQEKIKQTCMEKYGVESALASQEVRQKIISSMYNNDTVPTSKPQLECFNILKNLNYDVVLNYPVGALSLDVLIKTQEGILIDFEYDGWYWHQDKQKDCARNAIVKKLGYKIFRVKAFTNAIPTTEQMINGINELVNTDKQIYYIEIK